MRLADGECGLIGTGTTAGGDTRAPRSPAAAGLGDLEVGSARRQPTTLNGARPSRRGFMGGGGAALNEQWGFAGAAAVAAEQGKLEQVSRRAHMDGGFFLFFRWAVAAFRVKSSIA